MGISSLFVATLLEKVRGVICTSSLFVATILDWLGGLQFHVSAVAINYSARMPFVGGTLSTPNGLYRRPVSTQWFVLMPCLHQMHYTQSAPSGSSNDGEVNVSVCYLLQVDTYFLLRM